MSGRCRVGFAVLALTAGLGGLVCVARAQEPKAPVTQAQPAPVVSEVDALKLDKLLLTAENLQLRMAQVQSELQGALKAMEKPGFVVSRDPSGAWIYVKTEPKPEPPKQ